MSIRGQREPRERRVTSLARFERRAILRSLAAIGGAGVVGAASTGTAAAQEWSAPDDPYYADIVDELDDMGLPPAEFLYGDDPETTLDAYDISGSAASTESIDVGDDAPFEAGVRVAVSDDVSDPWDVTMIGTVDGHDISDGDVLLGVVWLRTPDESASIEYVAKNEANVDTNSVLDPLPSISQEWERYFFPIRFNYDAEPGWWTEIFLGYPDQTVEIGGIALLDFGQEADVDALPSWADDGTDVEGWEADADARIAEHRMSDLTVDVVDRNGEPVDGATVEVAQQDHAFAFGTAIDADHLVNSSDDRYREEITSLFNTAVMENHHKWRFWETEQSVADEATDWVIDQGMRLRGHVCLWGNVDGYAVPEDVVEAMGVEWEDGGVTDPDPDPEHVETRTFEHVESIIDHYGNDIEEWEVVNEVMHEPGLIEAIDGEDVDAVEAPVLAEWYRTARDTAPDSTTVAVNDYNVLVGPYPNTRSDYERQIANLTDEGLIDSVGVQCHFSGGETLSAEEVLEGLDRYSAYDVGLRVTEFDMGDPNWEEADKAEFFSTFLKTIFSHEAVEAFLMWGFHDDYHWEGDAPLFDSDWNPKPTHEIYTSLVFDEWWTDESETTDESGQVTISAFHGNHEITGNFRGTSDGTTTTVDGGGQSVTIELDMGLDESANGDDDDDNWLPGFGIVGAITALGISGGLSLLRNRVSTKND